MMTRTGLVQVFSSTCGKPMPKNIVREHGSKYCQSSYGDWGTSLIYRGEWPRFVGMVNDVLSSFSLPRSPNRTNQAPQRVCETAV